MEVIRCDSPEEFLSETYDLRALHPISSNVLGSVATSVATGLRTYDDYFWWLVLENDAVVTAAMRTAPHGYVLAPMETDAATLLGQITSFIDLSPPGVTGSREAAEAFLVARHQSGDSRSWRVSREEVLYEVTDLIEPTGDGLFRRAFEDDADLVVAWDRLFEQDVALDVSSVEATIARLMSGSRYLWEVNGEPVSMAGHAEPVSSPAGDVTRIGPVFTPRELRGHGYAALVTAALTRTLFDRGSKVMLYADAANATSNGVYQRLGYQAVDTVVQYSYD